jgi:hypothetical protein
VRDNALRAAVDDATLPARRRAGRFAAQRDRRPDREVPHVLPRVFLNAWRAWQRVPAPVAAGVGGRRAPARRDPGVDERLERVAVAVTEMTHAAMGSRQWDYCALAADQLSELHLADLAIDAAPTVDASAQRAFIEETRSLLAEFARIP